MSSDARVDIPHDLKVNGATWSGDGRAVRISSYHAATNLARMLEARGYTVVAAVENGNNNYAFLFRPYDRTLNSGDNNIRVLVELNKPLPYEVVYRHPETAWIRYTVEDSTWATRGEANHVAERCRQEYGRAEVMVRPSLYF